MLHASKTPQGVDVTPVYALQLNGDLKDLDAMAKLLPDSTTHRTEGKHEMLIFASPIDTADREIFRSVEISKFESDSAALVYYESYVTTFGRRDWRVFKNEGTGANRFFSSYRPPWMNTNHGIPVGVIDYPDILVTFLKKNVVIAVSFTAYRDAPHYVAEMNSDIVYVADLMKRSLAPASAR
jgi:hypothetical protein